MQRQRVLAINDLSGYSHTSLMSVIPIMSVMGISVCALPTAVLSSNTEQDGYKLIDLTNHLVSFLDQWSKLKLSFSAIYSGFLSSEHQVEIVIKAIEMFKQPNQLIVIDPVMADDGLLYSCFNLGIVNSMQKLVSYADVITPNLTEAALLVDELYNPNVDLRTVKTWCKALSDMGPQYIVITSVPIGKDKNKTAVVGYDKGTNKFYTSACIYQPVTYPGTGDIFTSVLTANLMNGVEFPMAIKKAIRFVSQAIKITMEMHLSEQEGICLEKAISYLKR